MDKINEILISCEQSIAGCQYTINPDTYREERTRLFSPSFPVITEPVRYESGCSEIIVISDLHISSGTNNMGVYNGSENFFADQALQRFVDYINKLSKEKKKLLVLNGDTFDFLRVAEFPDMTPAEPLSKKISRIVYSKPPAAPDVYKRQN